MRKGTILTGAFLVSALTVTIFNQARAQTNCDFKNNLEKLSVAEEASKIDDGAENIKNELSIRKELLNQALDCSISDALSLQSEVKSTQVGYSDLKNYQARLVSKIDEIIGYYHNQKEVVKDLGIEGSKIFSANLRTWRDSNYAPIEELGKNFPIFARNQDFLQTAQNRLYQISLTLRALELDGDQEIGNLVNQARRQIYSANEDNGYAADIYKRLSWPNNVSGLVLSTLQHLKDAYQSFFEIGSEAQKIISESK
ncbi:MAG: hypothetical protein HY432_02690 [Candidatus Liptonbacteria bacterium]|nr:hypothetical protein [Candidatus Liptonbacteria bacterium]